MDVRRTPPLPQLVGVQQHPTMSKFIESQLAAKQRRRADAENLAAEGLNVIASTGAISNAVTSQPQQSQAPPQPRAPEPSGYQGPGPQYTQAMAQPIDSVVYPSLPQNSSGPPQNPSGAPHNTNGAQPQSVAVSPNQSNPNMPQPPPPSYSSNTIPAGDAPTAHVAFSTPHMGNYSQAYVSDRNFVSAPAPPPNDVYAGMSQMPMPVNMHAYNPFVPYLQPQAPPVAVPMDHHVRAATQAPPPPSSSSSSSDHDDGLPANTYANRFKAILRAVTISEVGPMILLTGGMLAHHYRNRNASKLIPYQMPKWIRYLKNILFAYNGLKFSRNNGLIKAPPKISPTWPQETGKRGLGDVTQPGMGTRGLSDFEPGDGTRGLDNYDLQGGEPAPNDIVMQMVNAMVGELFGGRDGAAQTAHGGSGVLDGFDHSWAVPRALAEQSHRDVYMSGRNIAEIDAHYLGGAAAIQALETERQAVAMQPHVVDSQHEYRVMGMALSEVDTLLERKADAGALGSDDTLQLVGKVALATIIKIKAEEDDRGSDARNRRGVEQPTFSHADQITAYGHANQTAAYSYPGHAQTGYAQVDYAQTSYAQAGYAQNDYTRAYVPAVGGYQQHPPALDRHAHHSYHY
ncbi:hypothetical protein GGH12_004551 [Coemansia sp. RSA 1822]|nr:hypothetical protein LPJ76_004067 [Coemansia sp. RSA 638]KAJ2541142.1 hypothetical protein GGF49_003908 [Coemansia sp. RSA 1853]KAJ2560765.1 hypothetical protein GGH12_004551 [Coemansia sp. RSA 1822]